MRSSAALAAAGALALTLAACGSGGTATGGGAADGGTFVMVLPADPGNLDPHFTSLSSAFQVGQFLYDSLVDIDEKGEMVAGLAEKWEATTTTATYTLREGVTCSDGTPLTASDVAANISFVGDTRNASTRVGIFVPPGASATGDDATRTVTVTSPVPDAFLSRTVGGLQIVCPKGMADRSLLARGAVGSGMYTMTEAVPGDHYTLTRRPEYAWGPGDWRPDQPGLPDKVVLRVVANETTAANLLASGEVQVAAVTGPDRQRLQGMGLFERDARYPAGELWFNQEAGRPAADPAVRRALTQALDLGQLGQVLTSGAGLPSSGFVSTGRSPCSTGEVAANLPAHDLDAARAGLDAAGFPAGPDGLRARDGGRLSMSVFYPTSVLPGMQAAAELLQQAWAAVGVDVTLRGGADAETGQLVSGQADWDAAFIPLTVSLPSQLVPFLSGPTPPAGTNFAHIQNPGYTAEVQAAAAIPGVGGCDRWAAAERELLRNVDVVPFADATRPMFGRGVTFELSDGSVAPATIRFTG
ncbi:ABC transporter substrate-binding protein [Pseudonocardia xinjiangensis]|uniref:ABC transporter substrate-binding protein n=1 Tax=Pseudonocardia xinjiangensis TaxID=75289 RepID=A0ABX1RPP7_9PSEU|nr:ABC transporter substrate-binding protein [Pseudonocardia xinjiangensis]NMH81325.1 ABC transporter substrate-binding protein [Pseudonocardia xinjiangensis]